MANSVVNSLSNLNALAGKISPQTSSDGSKPIPTVNGNGCTMLALKEDRIMGVREPDPDAIKMFVGQIPRSMDESDLRTMFEQFGEVSQINVLRDKVTGQSKGCCFVTFYTRKSSLDAQNELHNIKTLPGMHHPIQMKPADAENRNERKLFIGMLSKRYAEPDVRTLFSSLGTIEECTVLRDANHQSKGCAFITFSSRQCAINAIKKIHHSQTMEGCSSPIVVKFADTQKEKDAKKVQNLWSIPSTAPSLTTALSTPQYLALLGQHQLGSTNGTSSPSMASLSASSLSPTMSSINNLTGVQQLLAASQQHQQQQQQFFDSQTALGSIGGLGTSLTSVNIPTTNSNVASQENPTLQGLLASLATHNPGFGINMQNLATLAAMTNGSSSALQALTATQPGTFRNILNTPVSTAMSLSGSKQVEGPDGANLFIYHLPQDFTDLDLAQAFWPYGKVISAKVFVDKQTNLSKCFGFVSYENRAEAERAIQHMNGQPIGNKRLKVQVKRSKNEGKPY